MDPATEGPASRDETAPTIEGGLLRLQILGLVVTLQTRAPSQHLQLMRDWSRCLAPSGYGNDGGADPVLVVDSELALTPQMRQRLTANLTENGIEHLAGDALLLHAAGIATKDGQVIALVAESGTGKSTAAQHLCRESFAYVTDETVAVGLDGRIIPFPKPLALAGNSNKPWDKDIIGPDALGLAIADGPLDLAALVLLDRNPDLAGPPTLEPITTIDAIVALISHTSAFTRLSNPLQDLARIIGHTGPVHRLRYREITDCKDLLRHLSRREVTASEAWEPLPSTDGSSTPVVGELVQVQPADAICVGDEALLLMRDLPVRLGPLALTLWRAASTSASPIELLDTATSAHGPHPRAATIVEGAISQLVMAGVLRRVS